MNDALDREDLDAWDVAPLDAGFDDRVLAAWEQEEPEETEPRRRSGLLLTTIGLVAAAILVVALWPAAPAGGDDLVAIRAGASAQVEYAPGSGRATQTAGTASYEVTKGTPFVVHTPAADITVHGTEFTVEMLTMEDTRRRKYLGAGALVMTGAAVAVYVASGEVEVGNDHGAVTLAPGQTAVAAEHSAPRSEPAPKLAKAPVVKPPKRSTKSITAREREDVQRRLADALAKRRTGHGSDSPKAAGDDEPLPAAEAFGSLDKEYIREVVAEDLVPIAVECYDSALQDEPDLGGNLVLQFSIVGDESVGGIVEEVSLAEGSTLKHPALAECMTESTATLLFDPPEDGGKVVVTYPFKFEPAEAE